jgi:type I restriction enzyme S subunit
MLDEKQTTGKHLARYLRNVDVQWGRISMEDLPVMDFDENDRIRFGLKEGDLLVCEGGDVGRAAILGKCDGEVFYQKALHRIRPYDGSRDLPQFLFYHLFNSSLQGRFTASGNKSTIAHLPAEALRTYRFSFPPCTEQIHIVAFLNNEIGKIDALMEEQRRLIALLEEKRQAVISYAVTKGIDPDVPMKDSEVKWLGRVPKHWTVCLLKRAFRSVDYGISDSLDSEGAVAILRMGNIEDGAIVTNDLKYTDSVDIALLLEAGDLLYNRTNSLDLVGKVGMFLGDEKKPFSFASYLVRLRTASESIPRYFAYMLNAEGLLGIARANAFVAIGQSNLNPSRYGEIAVAIPPKLEQVAIVEHLDRTTGELDALTVTAKRAIDLLQERRSALISAAVTGQIEVRNYRPREAPAACQ